MSKVTRIGLLMVSVWAMALAARAADPVGKQETPATNPADPRPLMHVKTAAEFVAAIGPRRIIEMEPGEYVLSGLKRGRKANTRWQEANDNEYELVIHDSPGMTIRCPGEKPAHIVMGWAYANVLVLEKCDGLELQNLQIGHAPDVGFCTGGVVKLSDTKGVTIEKCDLYGCGIQGLELKAVDNLKFLDSTIRDCSYGIMEAKNCDGLRFERSVFRGNTKFYGFNLEDCAKVSLLDCTIKDNVLGGLDHSLFKTNLSDPADKIEMKGGAIQANSANGLVNTDGMLKLEGVKEEGNAWQAPEEVKKLRGTKEERAGGGWTYHVAVGETELWDITLSVYQNGKMEKLLKQANPKLPTDHIKPDTLVICPPVTEPEK